MTFAKLSLAQAASINLAREHADDATRKLVKKEIFGAVKAAFGIPATAKVKCETTDAASPDYLIVKDSANGQPYLAGSPVVQIHLVAVPMAWFRIDASEAEEALTSYMENDMDSDRLNGQGLLPSSAVLCGTDNMAVGESGDVYIRLPADHFTEQ